MNSPDFGTRSSLDAIKDELEGKLLFNDDRVFRRLGLNQIPVPLVDACAAALESNAKVLKAQTLLFKIVSDASSKSEPELEAEVEQENGDTVVKGAKSKARERQMYKPLNTIFEYIRAFEMPDHPIGNFQRRWVSTGSATLTTEGDTWGFSKISPDFTLLEGNAFDSKLWRLCTAFAEIKPTLAQGPVSADLSTVKAIVTQAADYARLHISTRPFQLFSIGLLIFGSHFCVAIFDRDGVRFSPVNHMWTDLCTFIRVVRRLMCDMSPVELGQDPTVRLLPDAEAAQFQDRVKSLGVQQIGPKYYPVYVVTMGKGHRSWYTLGPPIWSSFSLLGRGTVIWRVCDVSNPSKIMVLKNAWRSSERLPESTIYQSIKGQHAGVADYEFGDDVVLPRNDNCLLSVKNLRDSSSVDEGNTAVLHRLVISTLGRPLWEATSELELLKGIYAALEGHQFLHNQGILHRDISAGNVLLGTGNRHGFVMDLEFAHHACSSLDTKTVIVVEPIRRPGGGITEQTTRTHTKFDTVSVKRGAVMTGTVQFMALQILEAMESGKPIKHELRHDLESFIWVLCYSVIRRLVSSLHGSLTTAEHKRLRDFFHQHFGRVKLLSIISSRASLRGPLLVTDKFPQLFSMPFVTLFEDMNSVVMESLKVKNSKPLTYDTLFGLLSKAIHDPQIRE